MSTYEYGKVMSKYLIHNLYSGVAELKSCLWRHFLEVGILSCGKYRMKGLQAGD